MIARPLLVFVVSLKRCDLRFHRGARRSPPDERAVERLGLAAASSFMWRGVAFVPAKVASRSAAAELPPRKHGVADGVAVTGWVTLSA